MCDFVWHQDHALGPRLGPMRQGKPLPRGRKHDIGDTRMGATLAATRDMENAVDQGRKATRKHIWVYTVLLAPVAVGAAFTGIGGPIYLAASVLLNGWFLWGAWRIWHRDEAVAEADSYKVEKSVFRFSLYYLFVHFGAILAEAALRPYGYGGW